MTRVKREFMMHPIDSKRELAIFDTGNKISNGNESKRELVWYTIVVTLNSNSKRFQSICRRGKSRYFITVSKLLYL